MSLFLVIALMFAAPPAFAHGGLAGSDNGRFFAQWSFAPLVILPLLASALVYARGVARLWRVAGPGRGAQVWQVSSFAAGWLALAAALVSPLHKLGEKLFTAHMIEHEILMVIAAPLIVVARPFGAFVWGLSPRARRTLGWFRRSKFYRRLRAVVVNPFAATLLHGVALWVWHLPLFYGWALDHDLVHWLQHVSFLGTAFLFWAAMLNRGAGAGAYGPAVFYLFVTALHSGFLGILLTVARAPVYPAQTQVAADWGMTALEDQQLAGLVMWVPAGIVYAAAALACAALWIARSGQAEKNAHASAVP